MIKPKSISLSKYSSTHALNHHSAGVLSQKNHSAVQSSMSKSSMASFVPDDSASLYDLEYRASEEDAWYSVCVVLDAAAEKLTVKYMSSPEVHEVVFSAGDFGTEELLEELVGRFRPVSRQLQDCECPRLSVGTSVCAAHGTGDNDFRFYDAVVDAVEHRLHSYTGGEEECLCTFVLYWKHGRGRGTLTPTNIASICIVEPATQIDPRLRAFAKMVNKKIASSKSNSAVPCHGSASNGTSNDEKNSSPSIKKVLGSSHNGLLKSEISMKLKSPTCKTEDSAKVCRYESYDQWTSHDEDMGPKSCDDHGLATTDDHLLIFIENLEKDLTPSSIENFIFEKTAILPEACVFPRHLSAPFARGAIMVDCQKKAQTIHEFLDNPNHFVVSSRGRPWVITEKAPARTFGANIWNLIRTSREGVLPKKTCRELEVVISGTDSYKRAEQLRNLLVEFLGHESHVFKTLVSEEKKILRSSQPVR